MDKAVDREHMKPNRYWGKVHTVIALLLAPGLGTATWMPFFDWIVDSEDPWPVVEMVSTGFLAGLYFGSLGSLMLGGFLHRVLQDFGQTGPLVYMATYPLIALLCGLVVGVIVAPGGVAGFMGAIAMMTAPAGALAGLYFWLIRRPDRIAAETRS